MATLETVLAEAMEVVAAVTGIRSAPSLPTDNFNALPFAVGYPKAGISSFGVPGERLCLDSIVIELHVARTDLAGSMDVAFPYADSIPNALHKAYKDDQWDGSIDTFEDVQWEFGNLGWGSLNTIGFRFTVTGIKRRLVLT